jgi:hypothetical protein
MMPAGLRRKRAREQQRVCVDGNGLRRDVIGDAGLEDAGVVALGQRLDDVAATLERHRRVGFALPPSELRRMVRLADQARGAFEDLVVLASGVGYLGGQGLGALADLQQQASEMALWSAGYPTMTLICPEPTAYAVGQVLYLVEAAATLARATVGTAPNDLPGAQRLAYGLAGRPGYEAERDQAQRLASHREARYVV